MKQIAQRNGYRREIKGKGESEREKYKERLEGRRRGRGHKTMESGNKDQRNKHNL